MTTIQGALTGRKYPRQKGARVDIRTTLEILSVIEQAATLEGLTVAEYAKAILVGRAQAVYRAARNTPPVRP